MSVDCPRAENIYISKRNMDSEYTEFRHIRRHTQPLEEYAMLAAVSRLVRNSRERRNNNCWRYEWGRECNDRVDWFISAAISGGSPPPKTALRSRSCRRPSDTECAAPFRLNCEKNVPVVSAFFAKFGFQKCIEPRKTIDFACVSVYFSEFPKSLFS